MADSAAVYSISIYATTCTSLHNIQYIFNNKSENITGDVTPVLYFNGSSNQN